MSDVELTERQRDFISVLPASTDEIARKMGISESTVTDHKGNLCKKGVDIRKDRDAGVWFLADSESRQLRQLSTRHKQSITKEATQLIEEEKKTLMRRLRRSDPLQADPAETPGKQTFGIILGDLHFGDIVEKEFWDEDQGEYTTQRVYSSEIAAELVQTFVEKALAYKNSLAAEFDDCALFIMGDIATGMSQYDGQWQDVDAGLNEQVEQSVSSLYQLIVTLSNEFETVQVRAIPGNHGTAKPSAALGVNTDVLTYSWVDDRLRDTAVHNVDLRYAEAHTNLNTVIRGWRFHLRHGEDSKEHVDETAASARDWRGWRDETKFDVGMKGHHHKPSYHKIMNAYPVFSAPSPKQGAEFASEIGSPDVSRAPDLGWVFGISDSERVTWKRLVSAE